MNTIAVLTLGCTTLFTIIVIFVNQADSKAMTLSEGKPHHIISKRNTWWSKKSMDAANRIAIETARDHADNSCEDLKMSFVCYTKECVPDFIWCSQEATSRTDYLQCQVQDRLCTTRCLGDDKSNLNSLLK